MGTSGNTIEMRIQVVDGGTAAVVQNVRTQLGTLDAEAAKLAASWNVAGEAAGAAGTQMAAAGQQMAEGAEAGTAGMNKLKNSAMLARFELTPKARAS
jgi:hypothetical protein